MSTNKKIPLRKCVATGEMLPKKAMIRVVRSKEGEVSVDATGKKSGRGAYVSKSEKAVELARKKNILERQLEAKIPNEVYEYISPYTYQILFLYDNQKIFACSAILLGMIAACAFVIKISFERRCDCGQK